jgi:HSP20 family protein
MEKGSIVDNGTEIVITINLPNVNKEDIKLRFQDESIEVSVSKKDELSREDEYYFISQKTFREFYRRITLPDKIVPDKTKANYSGGVLEIIAPKA